MVNDIIYQISVFGDFTLIKPNIDIIQTMIGKFSKYGLIPSVFQEQNFTLSPNQELAKEEYMDRLQMLSLEKKINVMFRSNRIDISRASTELDQSLTTEDLNELLEILCETVEGLSSTRIGFNTTSLLPNPNDILLNNIQPRLGFYNDPDELMLRVNKRETMNVDENFVEESNVILTIQKTMGQLIINNQPVSVDDGIILQFDINTLAENPTPRFFAEKISKYVRAAEKTRQSLLDSLLK